MGSNTFKKIKKMGGGDILEKTGGTLGKGIVGTGMPIVTMGTLGRVKGGTRSFRGKGGAAGFMFGSGAGNPFFFMVDDEEPDKPKQAHATDEEIAEAARREAEMLRARRRGHRGSILTGPTGVSDTPTTTKATLG